MKAHLLLVTLVVGGLVAPHLRAADWIVAPSYFSHDPQSGQRVTQYTPIGPFYAGYGYAEGGNSSLFLFLGKTF